MLRSSLRRSLDVKVAKAKDGLADILRKSIKHGQSLLTWQINTPFGTRAMSTLFRAKNLVRKRICWALIRLKATTYFGRSLKFDFEASSWSSA